MSMTLQKLKHCNHYLISGCSLSCRATTTLSSQHWACMTHVIFSYSLVGHMRSSFLSSWLWVMGLTDMIRWEGVEIQTPSCQRIYSTPISKQHSTLFIYLFRRVKVGGVGGGYIGREGGSWGVDGLCASSWPSGVDFELYSVCIHSR